MAYSSKLLAQLVTQICIENKVLTSVISPGSRNAPLIISFTACAALKTYQIVDERCAAFFALGLAQQTQKPVVIFCTSGSALLNYYPAIAEAFYSNIPLIVVSADRPSDKIDIGDGQTIRQENVFLNHSLYNANLIEEDAKIDFNCAEILKAFQMAILKKGPVHINIPFEEPLYNTDFEWHLPAHLNLKLNLKKPLSPNNQALNAIKNWNESAKKMILVGVNQPDKRLNKLLASLAADPSVIILTETTSNVYHSDFVNTIDNLIFSLTDIQLKTLKPNYLLTLGGMVVSKRIKQFLRTFKPNFHWHLSEFNAPDTYFCLSGQVAMPSTDFLSELIASNKAIESHFKADWLSRKARVEGAHNDFMTRVPHCDLAVFNEIIKALPKNINLQLANSSVIRYAQLFHINNTIKVFCNRGTSGIDGSTSTAIGAACAVDAQTVFITGDLSFFYDSNALWNNYVPKNFKIILINNGGGGIFRILPGPQSTNALDFFEAPHQFTAEHLCAMYHFEYRLLEHLDGLINELPKFFTNKKGPSLLEIKTPRTLNDKVLKEYFKILR
ncbi:MAG: 2-succinyl-5-enolpyruvyl-6-hydroxy-3-cyclohexene-1-carboxylic-acid synthase [Flavobacteriales bacterium CG_4_8_14_3_um_filter_35_10]|nr:MAG: 2-succinyl-5-enolpyruvyl-6-hydroxy-3-cyclohexene-1-carboxylic-acid synthase [Flavobacteriales bacterium CG_4_8_14_3_um_filter_35_10]